MRSLSFIFLISAVDYPTQQMSWLKYCLIPSFYLFSHKTTTFLWRMAILLEFDTPPAHENRLFVTSRDSKPDGERSNLTLASFLSFLAWTTNLCTFKPLRSSIFRAWHRRTLAMQHCMLPDVFTHSTMICGHVPVTKPCYFYFLGTSALQKPRLSFLFRTSTK